VNLNTCHLQCSSKYINSRKLSPIPFLESDCSFLGYLFGCQCFSCHTVFTPLLPLSLLNTLGVFGFHLQCSYAIAVLRGVFLSLFFRQSRATGRRGWAEFCDGCCASSISTVGGPGSGRHDVVLALAYLHLNGIIHGTFQVTIPSLDRLRNVKAIRNAPSYNPPYPDPVPRHASRGLEGTTNVQQESSPVVWSASRSRHVTSLQPWQTPPNKQFQYQNVQLWLQGSLSIGKVFNQLPCAVTLLHPVLFRFEQEGEFLSEIRHLHIVQYHEVACAWPRLRSACPADRIDGSLIALLEWSNEPLPYHYLRWRGIKS